RQPLRDCTTPIPPEGIQHRCNSGVGNLEERATPECSPSSRCGVKGSIVPQLQTGRRILSVPGAAGEGIEHGLHTCRRDLVHGPEIVRSAIRGGSIKVAIHPCSEAGIRITAISAAGKRIERCFRSCRTRNSDISDVGMRNDTAAVGYCTHLTGWLCCKKHGIHPLTRRSEGECEGSIG